MAIKTVKLPAVASKESAYDALNGVTVDWLRRAFHLGEPACKAKLKGCPIKAMGPYGAPIYDLGVAASYLVKPHVDLKSALKDITVDDLPDKLREPFWNARLKQQRYEKNAGELWRTEAVIALFGSVLKDIKERMRLIADLSEKALGLSPEQLQGLREIVNDVQSEIYNHIMTLESKTPASIAELNEQFAGDAEPDYVSETAISHDRDYGADDFEY